MDSLSFPAQYSMYVDVNNNLTARAPRGFSREGHENGHMAKPDDVASH